MIDGEGMAKILLDAFDKWHEGEGRPHFEADMIVSGGLNFLREVVVNCPDESLRANMAARIILFMRENLDVSPDALAKAELTLKIATTMPEAQGTA